jgi:hypothetical protein
MCPPGRPASAQHRACHRDASWRRTTLQRVRQICLTPNCRRAPSRCRPLSMRSASGGSPVALILVPFAPTDPPGSRFPRARGSKRCHNRNIVTPEGATRPPLRSCARCGHAHLTRTFSWVAPGHASRCLESSTAQGYTLWSRSGPRSVVQVAFTTTYLTRIGALYIPPR